MQITTTETNYFIRPIMANLTGSNFTNITSKFINNTMGDETANAPINKVSFIVTIIINSISCPFIVLLNVFVIMAVKRRPRLQNNANILLACLAATDALTGLTSQPSFAMGRTLQSLGINRRIWRPVLVFYSTVMLVLSVCSCLHLMLVTCERLIAIKFTMHYENIVTKRKLKAGVISCWIFSLFMGMLRRTQISVKFTQFLVAVIVISCIVFVVSCYAILYLETRRHQKMIKTQQMPQEEAQRFAKENKALKTTVYVVGALVLCFLPMGLTFVLYVLEKNAVMSPLWVRTFAMLNSLLNPLIYCWRQTEMRKFVFRKQTQAVQPAH